MSRTHAAVATDAGKALTWGYSPQGALGIEHLASLIVPLPVEVTLEKTVLQVACGVDFTLFLCIDETVYSCGTGALGALGHGDTTDRCIPTKGVDNARVMSMACGAYHTVLLAEGYGWLGNLSSGVAYSWGRGGNGALGHGTLLSLARPSYVKRLYHGDKDGKDAKTVSQVAAGRAHSAFLTKDGCVYTCGSNQYGQLGYYTKMVYLLLPGDVVLLHRELDSKIIVQIACGAFHVAALTDSGELLTCGTGKHGQLGHTHMRSSDEFQTVLLSKVERFASVSCGIVSTAAQT
ncbi:predicted protein, partial [Nematostella vectensis]